MATAALETWRDIKTLVEMSIGTDRGSWWADPNFGSDLWLLRKKKVLPRTVVDVEQEIKRCTAWLIVDGLARLIDVTAAQNGRNRVDYIVTVHRPDGSTEFVEGVWNGEV